MNQEIEISFKKGTRIEQIERSCFYLFSIFSALDSDPISDEHPLPSNTIADFSHIGAAFTDSIYRNISDFIEPDEDKEMTVNVDSESLEQKPDFKGLAGLLSKVLRHPDTPPHLWSELMQAVNTTHSDGDNEMINEMETSPEMLETILAAYHERHGQDES